MSETTTTPDQDVVRELTAKVQELCNILTPETPDKSRAALKAKDAVLNTFEEQIKNGRPEKILDWEKVDMLPVEDIEKEDKQYTQKYEEFWKEIDESTPSEKETAAQAYTSAFSRFAEIYHLLGWRGTADDDDDAMFDEPILAESRNLLVESVFSIEAYQMTRIGEFSERSRVLFETSRLPRLLVVLVRIAYRQVYIVSACGVDKPIKERPFDAPIVIKVLALVARTLKGAHLASSLSLEKILRSCYERRLLSQPDISDVETYTKQFDLIYDCVTALDFTTRYQELREPLCELFYMRYKSDSIQQLFERVKIYYDASRGIDRDELPLTESTESTFRPEIFSAQYLQDFGRLRIEWTDCLDEHLKIYAHPNTIKIFAHPTFFYNAIDLNSAEHDYTHPTYFELALTYALLFRPTSSRNIQRLKRYTTAGEEEQIRWHELVTFNGRPIHRLTPRWAGQVDTTTTPVTKLDINPLRYPTRDILSESFYRCSLPPAIQIAFDIASPAKAIKRVPRNWDQQTQTSTPMHQLTLTTTFAPNYYYPEDLTFMITSIMENDLTETESFVRFPYFAPRLRKIKSYLDSRQPSSMRELWVDRRDFRAWWMFWGGGVLGVSVLVVVVGILLVQVVYLSL